jgi:alkyl hydroperoxide reductase subunit D
MNLENLLNQLPEYAKDTKINLQNLASEQNQLLNQTQIFGCLLASAFATKNKKLIESINNEVQNKLSELEIKAIKIATSIMAMNNVYYRFTHLSEDKEYSQMQAGLRMRMLLEHKIAKVDFEIFSPVSDKNIS